MEAVTVVARGSVGRRRFCDAMSAARAARRASRSGEEATDVGEAAEALSFDAVEELSDRAKALRPSAVRDLMGGVETG